MGSKYAMAMELDDPGVHHSVLADFRDRPAEGGSRRLNLPLDHGHLETGILRFRRK
jgi:hypothetical protein